MSIDVFDPDSRYKEVVYFSDPLGPFSAGFLEAPPVWNELAKRLGIPLWGKVLVVVLIGLVASFGSTLFYGFRKLDKIESAVKVLAAKPSDDLRDLVRDLLSQAVSGSSSNNVAQVEKPLRAAPTLIAVAENKSISEPPEYFQNAIEDLNKIGASGVGQNPSVQNRLHDVRFALAEYRSSLERVTVPPDAERIPLPGKNGPAMYVLSKGNQLWDGSAMAPGSIMIWSLDTLNHGPGPVPLGRSYSGSTDASRPTFVINGTQLLDGIHWLNVVFVGMHIQYRGGGVELKNVRFVNCVFASEVGAKPALLADYVALGMSSLVL